MFASKKFDFHKATLLLIYLSVSSVACANDKSFGVSPAVVKSDTLVTISLPDKHPAYMAVQTPHHEWIYIVDKSTNFSFFKDFSLRSSFTFNAEDLQGIEFKNGKEVISKVFVEKGDYLFYFADNIETEPENTFSLSYSIKYLQ